MMLTPSRSNSLSTLCNSSVFDRALSQYLGSATDEQRAFVEACQAPDQILTPGNVQEEIIKIADAQPNKIVTRVLKTVIRVLVGYSDSINTITSIDPIHAGTIWGAIHLIINTANHFFTVFENIKKELGSLSLHLERINDYEKLYTGSVKLENLLCISYINILKFWNRVYIECSRKGISRLATVFGLGKLSDIIEAIEENADDIEKQAAIEEAIRQKYEREQEHAERNKADREREEASVWRREERRATQYASICEWLECKVVHQTNNRRYSDVVMKRMEGTGTWLLKHPVYSSWQDGILGGPSIIWLHAPPGSGKSTLCSHAINFIQSSQPSAAVAFYFYAFDQSFGAPEIIQCLMQQLLVRLIEQKSSYEVIEDIFLKTRAMPCSIETLKEIFIIITKHLPATHLLLDGLDEEVAGSDRWKATSAVLDLLIPLAREVPHVRLWCSSQQIPQLYDKLHAYVALDVIEGMKSDLYAFLSNRIKKLDVSDSKKASLIETLNEYAAGIFLWATLMVQNLEGAHSPADMARMLGEGPSLDDYYRKYFGRFDVHDRPLVCKVFSLVAFARRPLKIRELREAIAMLSSDNPDALNPDEVPFIPILKKLFAPLIKVESGLDKLEDENECRLFHGTLHTFLLKNPDILQTMLSDSNIYSDLRISPYIIANACLLYLSQAHYSSLLVCRGNRWISADGSPVSQHLFVTYAAKYWDKHFDREHFGRVYEWIPDEGSVELHERIKSFVISPKFLTCLQIQHLYISTHFSFIPVIGGEVGRQYLRRIFPDWFSKTADGQKLWMDYQLFLYDWRYFLQCGTCADQDCIVRHCAGEIDRCWWSSLAANNFLSKSKGRYNTFILHAPNGDVRCSAKSICCEGCPPSGDEICMLWLSSRHEGSLTFSYEAWKISEKPSCLTRQIITTTEDVTHWLKYTQYDDTGAWDYRPDRVKPIAFSSDCRSLRIGSLIFTQDVTGTFVPLENTNAHSIFEYLEEFVHQNGIIAFARRRTGVTIENRSPKKASSDDSIDGDSDSDEYSLSDSSDTSNEDSAYETWSECSSQASADIDEDDMTPWDRPNEEMSNEEMSNEEGDSDSSHSDIVEEEEEEEEFDYDDDKSEIDAAEVVGFGRISMDTQDYWWSEDEDDPTSGGFVPHWLPIPKRTVDTAHRASIVIMNITKPQKPLFHFTIPLPFLLYESPPVIHTAKSLAVWPLTGGDILFADYKSNTYFLRKLRSSTPHTRHIFMKCHFSSCGEYLHVAALEGQCKPDRTSKAKPPMKLAMLIVTYRLCKHQTTRTPPTLIYRSRIQLWEETNLSVTNLPFQLLWTTAEVFITCNKKVLRLYRAALFPSESLNADIITSPKERVLLPESAEKRNVYFFPKMRDQSARIIVGSGVLTTSDDAGCKTMLPVGCFLHEDHLGQWIKSEDATVVPKDRGVGQLDRPLEQFDPDEDCDLEPFLFVG